MFVQNKYFMALFLNRSFPSLFLFISSLWALLFALYSQYSLLIPPCKLCIIERVPYVVIIALTLFDLNTNKFKNKILFLAFFTLLFNFALTLFHVGVENSWVYFESECTLNISSNSNFEQFKQSLMQNDLVPCNQASASFLGLSYVVWHAIYIAFNLCMTAFLYIKKTKK